MIDVAKSKPSQVIVHRIELQEYERTLLEKVAVGKQVESYAKGAGYAVAAASLGVGAYVSWWTLDKVFGWMGKADDYWTVFKAKVSKEGSTTVTNPVTGETTEKENLGIFFPFNQWGPLTWLP